MVGVKAECYHYLFNAALKLHQLGLDPADAKHGPLTRPQTLPDFANKRATSKVIHVTFGFLLAYFCELVEMNLYFKIMSMFCTCCIACLDDFLLLLESWMVGFKLFLKVF